MTEQQERSDWGDLEALPPQKSGFPRWLWACGGGCLVMLILALFAGWWLAKETCIEEIGIGDGSLFKLWLLLVRIVAPLAVAAVFVFNLA